jgi:hypothetical protein
MTSIAVWTMKSHHKSYLKTVVLALTLGAGSAACLVGLLVFATDIAAYSGMPIVAPLLWSISVLLVVPMVLCVGVAIGGVLSLYRDISRAGRP